MKTSRPLRRPLATTRPLPRTSRLPDRAPRAAARPTDLRAEPLALRALGRHARIWPRLDSRRGHGLAALHRRAVGRHRLRLDLRVHGAVGMGGLPLRPLGLRARVGLVLGAWLHLGTRLGP